MYRVWYSRKAAKQIDRLPAETHDRVALALDELRGWPDHGQDVKPLEGEYNGHWRLRVGDYRAVFTVDDATREIEVGRISVRGRAY